MWRLAICFTGWFKRALSTARVGFVDKNLLDILVNHRNVSAWRFFTVAFMIVTLGLFVPVRAGTVQHLNTQTATATGAGAAGKPTIASFTIPSGKNRVLFIWATFERDHCSPADGTGGQCANGNTAGTGLGDNWPEPRTGTPPATTSNNQITAQVVGPSGSINKQNALVVGGTPSGDTRFINISTSPSGSPAGTAYFSLSSFHIVLFENDINTLLGGAASGTVSITLPDLTTPSNAGDDGMLIASVYQNVEQTVTGFVRNATATAQVTTGTPGNFSLAPAAYDAGQAPDEADDGKLVMAANTSTEGFLTPAGHTALATLATTNASGTYDTPTGNINNEPNGVTGGAYFRNGGATPASLYTVQAAGAAATLVYGGTNASFLLESDNADVGDTPVSYGNASHTLSGIRLGASVDADASLLNSADATGDDTNNTDDENGVTLVSLLPTGEITVVPISVQGAGGFLNAWFDWNADGDFNDAGEQMATNQAVAVGTTNFSVAVPATAIVGSTFARFRVCTNNTATDNCSTPTGTVQSGEVEDYQFTVSRKLVLRKTTLGAVGGPFGFTLTNTAQTTGSVSTTLASTPTQVDGDTGTAGTQVFTISSPTTAVTINENSLPSSSWSLTGATCVNASSTTVGSLSGSTYTITGAEIAASTSFTCTFTNTLVLTLSGTVWNDVDSSVTINGSEAGTNAGSYALTVYAVNGSGNVIAKALVATNGSYSFSNIPANTSFTLRLSNDSSVAVGSSALSASLPSGWTNTGENKNGTTETTTPGEIALTTGTANLSNYNFGITLPTPPSICAVAGGTRGANLFAASGNFGSTAGPAGTEAGALPGGRTTYSYTTLTGSSPNDGSYTVVNQPDVSVFGAWATPVDHTTGNLTGNMMIVNASYGPGVFYQETLTVTANTNYEFSFWIMNLIINGAPILPNVVLELNRIGVDDNNDGTTDEAGEAQIISSTGDIPLNNPIWRNFGGIVNSGTSTQLEVRFRNNAPGGGGNDLAIDDLVFSSCALPSGSLSGTLYQDMNGNGGFQSGTDTRFPAGVGVELVDTKGTVSTLDDVLVSTVQTDASGNYSFVNIAAGSNYTVRVASGDPQIPSGLIATAPSTASYASVSVTVGATTTRDFGYQRFSDLAISKTGPATVAQGNSISYTIRAWNNGSSAASGVTITDTVPGNISSLTWMCVATGTASCGSSSGSGNSISVLANLTVDTGATTSADTNYVTVTVTGTASVAGSITNTATITAPGGTVDSSGNNSSSVSTTITPLVSNVDLAVSKTSTLSGPQVGDAVIYTVTVQNLSTTNATGVIATDVFPTSLTFVETIGCAEDPNVVAGSNVICSLGTISTSSTKTFTVKGIVIDQGVVGDDDDLGRVINNSVSVTANETDSDTSNNSSSVAITVSKLQLHKEVRNVTAGGAFMTSVSGKPGDILEYRIAYTRTGPPIFDILLEDTLSTNITLEQNVYGSTTDKEIALRCPDGSDVFLETGVVTTISMNLVTHCTLNTASDATSTLREALLNGETGYFLFRARIR